MNKATWVYHNGKWQCNYCKNPAIITKGGYFAITHYCGNCGCKMSVEEVTDNG